MRVNSQYVSGYDQGASASTDNRSDQTHAGSAAPQTQDASIPIKPLQNRLSLPIVDPDVVWTRLQGFENHVHEIEQRQREGGTLSDVDRSALAAYDELRSDPLFPRKANGGEPTAMRRVSDNPSGTETTTPGPTTKKEDGPRVQYIGGIQIKRDYTFEEGANIFVDALRKPFSSFARSATDTYLKMNEGRPISGEEGQEIDRYVQFIDAAYSMAPQGRVMVVTGSTLDVIKNAGLGKPLTPETMVDAMQSATNVRDPMSGNNPSRSRQTNAPTRNFNPPTRFDDGRIAYPLSPTRPPRLPKEPQTSGASGTRGPHERQPSAEPSSGGNPDPRWRTQGTTGAIPRRPLEPPTGTQPTKGVGGVVRKALSRLRKTSVSNGHVERLIGKGPFNVEPPANSAEEGRRIHEFPVNFDFYRKDGEGGMTYGIDTRQAQSAKDLRSHVRQDVLTVGNGSQVTSEESHSKVRLGEHWGPSRKRLSKDVSVIELANGRNGVGAIRIPYENLKPGQTVVVTGGSLSGCTMMFASDTGHFYAYHAGTYGEGNERWTTSHDGANAIRYASNRLKTETSVDTHNYEGNNNDLVHVGNKYPFSVIVYNGKYEVPAASGNFLKPSDPQPVDARITEYQGAINHGTYAFDYHISNQEVGQLGTAEAVIRKDKQGVVTVRVLAEKGEVELPGPKSRQGGEYTYTEAKTYEYKPGE
ncbi:cytotoxic necrotizing factor Rho-activating domain-containing protein [Paraburkholderia haematera]|uniref:Cytotoxic necrotizing factor Rho-activating domain-containing protein n=1 Tax=Paraburkholderia haematera TaxID=2793077 RepID=A0ABN7MQB5_9BURK|nr:cytotoxic necrotizing factor Rho-activating domain-containing protein [Paraburkholderia haematera]CAE6819534.1 hypothetical protein R69888_06036 [Paraburkholderia haematera]